jgi:hypothetical protein
MEERIKQIEEYNNTQIEPVHDIDCYCDKPNECAYKKYCSRHIPEKSVFDLARMQTKKKYELYHEGIITYDQILEHADRINANQKRQVESIVYDLGGEVWDGLDDLEK